MKINRKSNLITNTLPNGQEQCIGYLFNLPNGQEQCVGYLFNFDGHGFFSPDGKVEVTKEELTTHNQALATAEVQVLDHCVIGQWGTFYLIKNQVQTFTGLLVSDSVTINGASIIFTRNGKTFKGRLQKEADCFNFRRVS